MNLPAYSLRERLGGGVMALEPEVHEAERHERLGFERGHRLGLEGGAGAVATLAPLVGDGDRLAPL